MTLTPGKGKLRPERSDSRATKLAISLARCLPEYRHHEALRYWLSILDDRVRQGDRGGGDGERQTEPVEELVDVPGVGDAGVLEEVVHPQVTAGS